MSEHFHTIPSKDGDQLAKAQRRLLAEECMKDLCKDLGYAMPERLTTDRYDPSKIPLILAIGCKNYEETEKVKSRWAKPISYDQLVKVFGVGK